MSLQIEIAFSVPKETARVAQASFPKGNVYMTMRDQLGTLFEDEEFADLFPPQGQPAEAPWRLALVTVMQFAENLPDRQAADCVRSRIDWKYAMGLELTDDGFDFSILSEFRARLLQQGAEQRLFDLVLTLCRERGWVKARGKQRTDSTHVLAAIHALNRLENAGETLRHTLDVLAAAAPAWLRENMQPEWADRYGKRFENYRLPRDKAQREMLAVQVGTDGMALLTALYAPDAPLFVRQLPAVQVLRQVWVQQFVVEEGNLRWRDSKELPPSSILINSPYDAEARYSMKRDIVWTGYKAHLTETCDTDTPNLITHVQTTPGTTQDCDVTAAIHADLAEANLLPNTHFADEGYLDAPLLVDSQKEHGVELLGPVARDGSWQAVAGQGFDQSQFTVDWEAQQVTCPRGKQSRLWMPQKDGFDNDVIHVKFSAKDCQACEARSLCTHSQLYALPIWSARGGVAPERTVPGSAICPRCTEDTRVSEALQRPCRDRRDAFPGHRGGWLTALALHRAGQDPLAERGHCHRPQCFTSGRLVGQSATRKNTNLILREVLRTDGSTCRGSLNNSPTTSRWSSEAGLDACFPLPPLTNPILHRVHEFGNGIRSFSGVAKTIVLGF